MQVTGRELHGLFDREAELAAIEGALSCSLSGEGVVLVLRGPAGIGKSALLRAAARLADLRGLLVLRARAAAFERGFPYGVVRQLFEPVLARSVDRRKELFAGAAASAETIFSNEPRTEVAADPSFASLHALYWLTSNLAGSTPVLMCVDDVTWCDDPSLRFLEFLARRADGVPLTLVLAYRTGESSPPYVAALAESAAQVLDPRPLSEPALSQLLASELAGEVDPAFSTACVDATAGNPLLLTELLRALHAEGIHPSRDEVGRVRRIGAVAVGPTVQRRFALLGDRVRAVAQAASILGESVRRDDLAATTALTVLELADVLAVLANEGLIRPGDRVSFVHPLVADAVRDSLGPAERAKLHDLAVTSLSRRDATPWELAPHLVAGSVRAHERAVEVLRDAAHWALAAGAPEAAARYLARALDELQSSEDPAPVLLALGKAKVQAGDPSARHDLERAIQLSHDARTRALARTALSVVLFAAGEATRSIQILDEGMNEIAGVDPELSERIEGHLLSTIEVAYPNQPTFASTVRDRITKARADRSRNTIGGRMVLCALAFEEMMGGGAAADVVGLADAALANHELVLTEGPMCMPIYRAVVALICVDELDRALATVTLAMTEARRLASPTAFVWASAWRTCVHLRRGRLVDAEADAQAALEMRDLFVSGYGQAMARLWLAAVLTEEGRFDEARSQLTLVPEPHPPSMVTYAMIESRIRLHLSCHEYEAAWQDYLHYRSIDDPPVTLVPSRKPTSGSISARALGAQALIGLGKPDEARVLIDEELVLARQFGTHRAIGMALHVAGMIERGDSQVQTLKLAVDELEQSQSRLEYAKALCDYGAALRRSNRRSEARGPLEAALAIARNARAAPLRDKVADELKASGVRVSRPTACGVDALTASEHRIASMAASGMSNRDIAQALFVTVKTVETHLGHIYDKLGVNRRSELAAALRHGSAPEPVADLHVVHT